MAPSLSELYQILKLPRISNIDITQRCVIENQNEETSNLHLLISGSSISTYKLIPSPKLVWSYSLSPSMIAHCFAVYKKNGDSTTIYAAGLYNTSSKKNFLKIVINNNIKESISSASSTTASQDDDESINNPENNVIDVEFSDEIKNISFSKSGKYIYLLLSNGDIKAYNHSNKIESFENPISELSNNRKSSKDEIIYQKFINKLDDNSKNNNNDGFWIVVKKSNEVFKSNIYMLNNGVISQLVDNLSINKDGTVFSYNSGILYQFSTQNKSLNLFTVPNNKLVKSISLESIFKLHSKIENNSHTRIVSPSTNRILINIENEIYLINTKFETILSNFQIPANNCFLLNVGEVLGNSSKNSTTSLNLLFPIADGSYSFNNLAVDVGNNSLVESIGKGIKLFCEKKKSKKDKNINKGSLVIDYLIKDLTNPDKEYINEEEVKQIQSVIENLKNLAKKNQSESFDLEFINFIKNKNHQIENIKVIYSEINELEKNHEVFNDNLPENIDKLLFKHSKNDYKINNQLFFEILKMIFKINKDSNSFNLESSKKFFPKLSIIYLINSNLFPINLIHNDLLQKFQAQPMILNFIISKIGLQLSIEDVLIILSDLSENTQLKNKYIKDIENEEDDEEMEVESNKDEDLLFKKLVLILVNDKSSSQVIKTVAKLSNSNEKKYEIFNKNLEKLMYKIMKSNFGISLLNMIIDGIGILNFRFNNDASLMMELIGYTDYHIANILKFESVENVLGDIIKEIEYEENSKQVKNPGKVEKVSNNGPKIITVKNQKIEEKINNILGTNLGIDDYNEKVVDYSIDRLVGI